LKNGIKDYYPTQENNTYTSQNAKILHSQDSVQLPELEARSKAPRQTPLQGRKEGTLCVSAKTKQQDFLLVFITFAMAGSLQQLFAAATNTAIASSA
jgi:hypothetical protein